MLIASTKTGTNGAAVPLCGLETTRTWRRIADQATEAARGHAPTLLKKPIKRAPTRGGCNDYNHLSKILEPRCSRVRARYGQCLRK